MHRWTHFVDQHGNVFMRQLLHMAAQVNIPRRAEPTFRPINEAPAQLMDRYNRVAVGRYLFYLHEKIEVGAFFEAIMLNHFRGMGDELRLSRQHEGFRVAKAAAPHFDRVINGCPYGPSIGNSPAEDWYKGFWWFVKLWGVHNG